MSEKRFTQEEIEELQKNPYVKKASEKSITYTDEFNRNSRKSLHHRRQLQWQHTA